MRLFPCSECARHIAATEARCPFCGAHGGPTPTTREPSTTKVLGRAAMFYFGLTLAACGPGGEDAPPRETIAQPYGAPPEPEPIEPPPPPPEDDDDSIAQPYGAPPEPEPIEPPPVDPPTEPTE